MEQIRKAKKEDWEDIERIFSESIRDGKSTFRTECPKREEWEKETNSLCRLVYEKDGLVIGFAAIFPFSSIPAYGGVGESSIYIDSDFRNKGIGTKLLNELIDTCRKTGYWSVCVKVFAENNASIALHKKCGFRIVGYRERIAKDIFGRWQNIVELERRL